MTSADRVKAITESPLAKGREELAEYLACHSTLSVTQAIEALSHAPVDLESPSLSMRKSMERVISQMGYLRAAAASRTVAEAKASTRLTAAPAKADADPDEVRPRMTLAERAQLMHGR